GLTRPAPWGRFPLRYTWRSGRVVEGSGFENRRTERYQGFESLLLRQASLGERRRVLVASAASLRRPPGSESLLLRHLRFTRRVARSVRGRPSSRSALSRPHRCDVAAFRLPNPATCSR